MKVKNPIKKILLVVDGHDASLSAARYAILLAKSIENSKLFCVAVVNTKALSELLKSKIFIEEESYQYAAELKKNAEKYLTFVENLANKKGIKIEKIIKEGSIHGQIIELSHEINADIIITAQWPHSATRRDLLDNEHRIIAEEARIPTLIVPNTEDIERLYLKL